MKTRLRTAFEVARRAENDLCCYATADVTLNGLSISVRPPGRIESLSLKWPAYAVSASCVDDKWRQEHDLISWRE